ncbi:hypothetical protein RV134_380018 [Roseovarius sp. EC-HK134]|nr:hypothetical protein RV420_460085 [Roseovarius sp. EC-SD190]VVT33205.1 hypothetical protein RV134_380018 [Roseovarius sp. EC-HK134]
MIAFDISVSYIFLLKIIFITAFLFKIYVMY